MRMLQQYLIAFEGSSKISSCSARMNNHMGSEKAPHRWQQWRILVTKQTFEPAFCGDERIVNYNLNDS